MIRVKVKIKESDVHGIGLFADEFIPQGTTTWQYDEGIEKKITQEELDILPKNSKEFFLYYSYFDKVRNCFVLPIDHLRFINHTDNAIKENIESTPDKDVAKRDIQIGEELLCNYSKFDADYFSRMNMSPTDLI